MGKCSSSQDADSLAVTGTRRHQATAEPEVGAELEPGHVPASGFASWTAATRLWHPQLPRTASAWLLQTPVQSIGF